jgi:hypothetical protein
MSDSRNIAKEFYAGRLDKSAASAISMVFILEDNTEVRLQVPRDLAHAMQLEIFTALDALGVHKLRDVQ